MTLKPESGTCVVLGGGGHASVVIDAVQCQGDLDLVGVLDNNPALAGGDVLGVPVLGGDDLLAELPGRGVAWFIVGLGTVGRSAPRRALFEAAVARGLAPATVVHPAAVVAASARIGAGTAVCAGAVVNPGADVGANVIINTGAIVEHHCVVGDGAHIATGACMGGGVSIGHDSHVGAGAVIRQGITIGDRAMVGAGAVVVADVPSGHQVMGNPARPEKKKETT